MTKKYTVNELMDMTKDQLILTVLKVQEDQLAAAGTGAAAIKADDTTIATAAAAVKSDLSDYNHYLKLIRRFGAEHWSDDFRDAARRYISSLKILGSADPVQADSCNYDIECVKEDLAAYCK